MEGQEQTEFQREFLIPIEIILWIGIIGIPLSAWFLPLPTWSHWGLVALSLFSGFYVSIVFHYLFPRFELHPFASYLAVSGLIFIVTGYALLLRPYHIPLEAILIAVIAGMGILAGKRLSLWAAILSVFVVILFNLLQQSPSIEMFLRLLLQTLIMVLASFSASHLAGAIHERVLVSNRRNRYLSTLSEASMIASRSDNLNETLTQIAEMIVRQVPVTYCQISLLNPQGDHLKIFGTYPQNRMKTWGNNTAELSLSSSPLLQQLLVSGEHLLIQLEETLDGEIEDLFKQYFHEIKTICLVPLGKTDQPVGLIHIGEERRWRREPFTQEKIDFLRTLAAQISSVIRNTQLFHDSQRHAERLSVLNEVAKAIGSTIELDNLLELLYVQLSKVIPSDTYFVSLYDEKEDCFEVRILIDEGERYPPQRVPVGKGLSGWIYNNRQPLLIGSITEEVEALSIQPLLLGKERTSESWLGTPIMAGENFLGLLAIASYTSHEFDEEDLNLLSNVAAQAGLALDNARRHAEVKEQARCDSLTGVYNHGYLLVRLEEEINLARLREKPVSLIMMDIDFFKNYNDAYGHVMGDEVLRLLANAIQSNLKESDIVGRWGGEEFAIALPGATTDQALQVAERIRISLAELDLRDKGGERIHNPTISQGIATYPAHAKDKDMLVDVADFALYQAKGRGRDQVMVFETTTA